MGKLYSINGMGRGFDGLIVEAESCAPRDNTVLFEVRRIINRNEIFGDRNVSFPVPPGMLYLDGSVLTESNEEPREYDSKNPYGKFNLEARFMKGTLEIVMGQYERAVTITVYDRGGDSPRTLYSQTFNRNFAAVKEAVETATEGEDVDDLIFRLGELKEMEGNG